MNYKPEEYLGKVLNNKTYGPYIITRVVGKSDTGRTLVEVKFLESENTYVTLLGNVLCGRVHDPHYGVNFNKTYLSNNYGPYIVLETYEKGNNSHTTALIRFINTGTEKIERVERVLIGDVKDEALNVKIPIDTYRLTENDRNKRLNYFAMHIWHQMHDRCNKPSCKAYKMYGGIGVRVCDRWMDKNLFMQDLPFIAQYEKWVRFPTLYQLDKDYLQQNVPREHRIYSPETCIFLHQDDNINIRTLQDKNNTKSKYFGVYKSQYNSYNAEIMIRGNKVIIGCFTDEIAAANAYNWWYRMYRQRSDELVSLLNDVPYMPPNEFLKYLCTEREVMAVKVN